MGVVVELDAAATRSWNRITSSATRGEARPFLAPEGKSSSHPLSVHPLVSIAQALTRIEQFDDAARILRRHIAATRAQSAMPLPYELSVLAEIEVRMGDLAAAYADAHEAVRLAPDVDPRNLLAYALVTLARVESLRGRERESRSHLAAARTTAASLGIVSILADADRVLGLLELSLGRPQDAIRVLEPIPRLAPARGVEDLNMVPWQPDLIEAYVRVGRHTKAERELEVFEQDAARTGGTCATASALRCRALLAPVDQFDALFAQALALHATQPLMIDRARTQLCFGERLRREGFRRQARTQLGEALDTFELAGAHLWASRTRAELLAAGEHREPRPPGSGHDLTAQEPQVARVVGEGATNAEVAARLFISTKTVEKHLTNTYRKLGIRSRAQLVWHFARMPAQP